MAHRNFLTNQVIAPDAGFSHVMMFGVLMRLSGADISIIANVGRRFGFTAAVPTVRPSLALIIPHQRR